MCVCVYVCMAITAAQRGGRRKRNKKQEHADSVLLTEKRGVSSQAEYVELCATRATATNRVRELREGERASESEQTDTQRARFFFA